jgi:hypothetical protein
MAYLLVLGFLCSVAFVYAAPGRGSARLAARLGFGLLAVGLLAQLALGFRLDENFARLFYLARYLLAAAWLGLAAWLLLDPKHEWADKVLWGLVAASVVGFILIDITQVTRAEDWFQPAVPAYSQIQELLATNRPTRWGAAGLSAAGLLALLAGAASWLRRGRLWPAVALAAGALALAAPLLWPPRAASLAFYAIELAAPIFVYAGLLGLADRPAKKRRKK